MAAKSVPQDCPATGKTAGEATRPAPVEIPAASLAEALVEGTEAEVVATLLANHGTDYSESLLIACLDRCPTSVAIHKALIGRSRLPVAVALRLVTLASEELSELLVARHPMPAVPGTETVELTRNRPGWWSQQLNGYFS